MVPEFIFYFQEVDVSDDKQRQLQETGFLNFCEAERGACLPADRHLPGTH